mmetsp:Transcript_13719/g.35217  ORF Transcript_13719/g.35217 Transcript_13719/m.35217 type:complete len:191 (+) Transcript_13719:90-662(+)
MESHGGEYVSEVADFFAMAPQDGVQAAQAGPKSYPHPQLARAFVGEATSAGPGLLSAAGIPRVITMTGEAGKFSGLAGGLAAGRRRKKNKMSVEEEAAEAEMKKQKSVQSARDCRRRKKAFIQSLQLRVKECEEREADTQRRIANLEQELSRLQAIRGVELEPMTVDEAAIIETLRSSALHQPESEELLG